MPGSKNHDQEYYIGRKADVVNKRLEAIRPPTEIHRAPRSLSERHYWKASEWWAFLLYSLVVLQRVLPVRFLNHYFLYVYGIYTLLGDSIDQESISSAKVALTKFVIQVEHLYGLRHCSYNIHSLTHLAHCVKNCGPLWATSAFIFESHNHCLLKMFNGTQYVPQQITDTFLLKRKLASFERLCSDDDCSASVVTLLEKLNGHTKFALGNTTGLGRATHLELTASQALAIQNLLMVNVVNRCGISYERFVYSHRNYSSVNYTRAKRHSNYSVLYQTDEKCIGTVLNLMCIKPSCQCSANIMQYCNCKQYSVVLLRPTIVSTQFLFKDSDFGIASNFLHEVVDRDHVVAIHPIQILRKCVLMEIGVKKFICPLPYRLYGD